MNFTYSRSYCRLPSATKFSIVEKAKTVGLNLFAYLTYAFEQLPNINTDDRSALERLLPNSPDLPDSVRMPAKLLKI